VTAATARRQTATAGRRTMPYPDHPDARLIRRSVAGQVRADVIDWPAVPVDLGANHIALRGGVAGQAPWA
jgi:hypothetical protein